MPPVGFEPTISASDRPQNHVLERAATGTGARSGKLFGIRPCVDTGILSKSDQHNNILYFIRKRQTIWYSAMC